MRHLFRILAFALVGTPALAMAESYPPDLFRELHWRMIGPFRGGRTCAATGVPGRRGVYVIGVCNGGVWRTTDFGVTWRPLFDGQPTQSVGSVAVAPSDPDVLYVGSGEGLQRPDLSVGDGLYRSTDGGKSWIHGGLRDGQQIPAILVDPRKPETILVAVLGHPFGPNEERGVFRSTDGGATFAKVLYKDENTGAIALSRDPVNPEVVYAALWESRQGPWEEGEFRGAGSGLHKSSDGGKSWRPIGKGLPTFAQGLGRMGIAVAPSDPGRLYAVVEAAPDQGGVFRSEDGGERWRRVNAENRVGGRASDFAEIKVDPENADVVWVANTSTYRSIDGGRTFTAVKGAPGGDDYHAIWIDPSDPKTILLASDQGATLSVNGGETWSSWYNQPTAQLYHVSTDNRFPYRVYGGQQESGSVGIASRGDYGAITLRDWYPVGAEEYGYVAPDPLNPDIVYGGKLSRFSHATKDVQDVSPESVRSGKYRFLRTAPILFSPVDPHVLYYAGNVLFKTTTAGRSWEVISPDLSREAPEVPPSVGVYRKPEVAASLKEGRRGVIYALAPSPRDVNLIWAGTDDGLIHLTKDGGKTWMNVTPPALTSWSKVSMLEASRFDAGTAYAAINRFRLDDLKPYVFRTRDFGVTWTEIGKGLPENSPVNSVREDPVRKGLLYAATERGVSVTFDDGESWQSLQLNLPATSVRDLVVHEDDLVVGTHGRSFWILDDVTPLRQLAPGTLAEQAHLFAPQAATRVRRSRYTDTPMPPEEPAGENPPDGAIVHYFLKSQPADPVTMEILDAKGSVVRRYSSADVLEPVDPTLNVPTYWVRPPRILPNGPGLHRFVWDFRYPDPRASEHGYPISAVYRDTPRGPQGFLALPGPYTVKLTVDGKSLTQPFELRMDPRVPTSPEGPARQFTLAMRIYAALQKNDEALQSIRAYRATLKERIVKASDPAEKEKLEGIDTKAAALEGGRSSRRGRRGSATGEMDFGRIAGALLGLLDVVDSTDSAPTTQAFTATADLEKALDTALARWESIRE
ncbi:MAG: WD40/YVTN/BNR-like repeat-containing protein [Thermoanaerobaculia bacterium]